MTIFSYATNKQCGR